MPLTQKEFDAINELNAEYRKAMFEKTASENGGFFMLVDNDGPLILSDTEEDDDHNLYSIVPVWSHQELAESYAKDNGHENMHAQFVTKDAWNSQWLPMLKEQKNVLIGFMPVKDKDFTVDDPFEIK